MLWFNRKGKTNFFNLLIQAAENTLQAAQIFRGAMLGDKPPATYFATLKDMENKGDGITHEIFKGLHMGFIAPLDRGDIMELAVKLDDVLDGIEATIARFDYLNIDYTNQYMKDFSEVLVLSCEHILLAFKLLAQKNTCKSASRRYISMNWKMKATG